MIETGRMRAWLSLGSNIEPAKYIESALKALRHSFGDIVVSPVYESVSVGFNGDNFHNLVVGLTSSMPPLELVGQLHQIENANGRQRNNSRFASRTIDIDLLTYGGLVFEDQGLLLPRPEILQYAFVLLPLSVVAGDELHPLTGKSYQQHWEEFDSSGQVLRRLY